MCEESTQPHLAGKGHRVNTTQNHHPHDDCAWRETRRAQHRVQINYSNYKCVSDKACIIFISLTLVNVQLYKLYNVGLYWL